MLWLDLQKNKANLTDRFHGGGISRSSDSSDVLREAKSLNCNKSRKRLTEFLCLHYSFLYRKYNLIFSLILIILILLLEMANIH